MKKLIIAALAVAAATTMYAQGTVSMVSDNAVTYGASCGALVDTKVGPEIVGNLMYEGQIMATQAFANSTKGNPTGKMKGDVVATLLPAGVTVSGLTVQAINPSDSQYFGESAPFSYTTGNPNGVPPTTPEDSLKFDSFTVEYIPEPTTIALGILGLSSLLVLRRRD